ncbi:hypothetical protein TNCV_943601 [Trichonephila clavipes]|nr:hypothetical protein TNCV_943601 [Trichonephila clavipes]
MRGNTAISLTRNQELVSFARSQRSTPTVQLQNLQYYDGHCCGFSGRCYRNRCANSGALVNDHRQRKDIVSSFETNPGFAYSIIVDVSLFGRPSEANVSSF